MDLNGFTAIVTGSSGQLGKELGLALAKAGCNCICQYHDNLSAAAEVAGKIQQTGPKAVAIGAKLDSDDAVRTLFCQIENWCAAQKVEQPRILINGAAGFEKQPLSQASFESARALIDLNLVAPIMVSRYFVEQFRRHFGSGQTISKIVNIADSGAIRPWANYSVYCASKAGLVAATHALAKELAPDITVNALAPGVATWPAEFDENDKRRQLNFIPLGRIAKSDEVAAAMLFLLANDYVTGQVLCVDGGRTL